MASETVYRFKWLAVTPTLHGAVPPERHLHMQLRSTNQEGNHSDSISGPLEHYATALPVRPLRVWAHTTNNYWSHMPINEFILPSTTKVTVVDCVYRSINYQGNCCSLCLSVHQLPRYLRSSPGKPSLPVRCRTGDSVVSSEPRDRGAGRPWDALNCRGCHETEAAKEEAWRSRCCHRIGEPL